MAIIIKSSFMKWWDVSSNWFTYMNLDDLRLNYLDCLAAINDAKTYLDGIDNLATVYVPVTEDNIEKMYTDSRKFNMFCNAIHYEISELVDTPFSVDMGSLTEKIIELNPSDYKYVKSKFLWFKSYMSLTDLVSSSITDDSLKKSFDDLAEKLDVDTVSGDLEQSIKEANFWQEQFELAEKIGDVTDEIFTPEVKEKWPNMTEDERKTYIEAFKNRLGDVFAIDGVDFTKIPVQFNETAPVLAQAHGDNHVGIRPEYVTDPTGQFSLDNLIDSMTHEMRHRYQRVNAANGDFDLPDNIRYGWTLPSYSNDPTKTFMEYYKSPVEADAKAFAALSQDDD